jgi:hypothetical protein
MNRKVPADAWGAAALFLVVALISLPLWKVVVLVFLVLGLALPFWIIEKRMIAAAAQGRSLFRLHVATACMTVGLGAALFAAHMVRLGIWKLPAIAPLLLLAGCMLDGLPTARLITVHF